MIYKNIVKPYKISFLNNWATGDKGDQQGARETIEWSKTLNEYAKEGFRVFKAGTFVSGDWVTFYALLEKLQE